MRKRNRKSGKGSLASVVWPAKNLLLSSCPQRSERLLLILSHSLVGPFPPPFPHLPSPHSLRLRAPTEFLLLPPGASRPSWLPAGALHLPLGPDRGSPGRPGKDSPTVGAVSLQLPLAGCNADSQGRSPSLSLRDSRLLSAG